MLSFLFILLLHVIVVAGDHAGYLSGEIGAKFHEKLNMDLESNFPAFFNTLLFVIASFFLLLIYLLTRAQQKASPFNWLFLSAVFIFLALDENASVHEFFVTFMPKLGIGGEGFFLFAWVIPYGIGTLLFLGAQVRFLSRLERFIAKGFILSGVVYVGGAIGMEMITSKIASQYGIDNIPYEIIATLEESMEMCGLIMFIHFLGLYIRNHFPSFKVDVVN